MIEASSKTGRIMSLTLKLIFLAATTLYQSLTSWREDQQQPPGSFINVGGYRLHLQTMGQLPESTTGIAAPTVIFEHSLGGSEGYLLIEAIAKLTRVCIYDRAGYGWSDRSPHPRTSQQIVTELDTLLTRANIQPPYILVGDSFGSYNVRLYAHRFPEKVVGLVLTDGLHESGMLNMPLSLRVLQLFFASGFVMSVLGSTLGIIRLLKVMGAFEWIKPNLRQFSRPTLAPVKRSFCRPKHWITMTQEILTLDVSGRQLQAAFASGTSGTLATLPIVSIKAASFLQPSVFTMVLPLRAANRLRDQMQDHLLQLSAHVTPLLAERSSHFVWIDQPELIVKAIELLLKPFRVR